MESIEMFGEEVPNTVILTASKNILDINDDAIQLDGSRSELFHSLTAKLIYVTKISQPDLEPKVRFLCTRVSNSEKDDWKRLL